MMQTGEKGWTQDSAWAVLAPIGASHNHGPRDRQGKITDINMEAV